MTRPRILPLQEAGLLCWQSSDAESLHTVLNKLKATNLNNTFDMWLIVCCHNLIKDISKADLVHLALPAGPTIAVLANAAHNA